MFKKSKYTKEWMGNYLKDNPAFLSEFVLDNLSLETLHEIRDAMAGKFKWGIFETALKKFPTLPTKKVLPDLAVAEVGQRKTITDLTEFIEDPERKQSRPLVRRRTLAELDERQQESLFMELIIDIANELAVDALCNKILNNVAMLTGSDRCSLYLVRVSNRGEHFLESKMFSASDPAGRICTPMQEGGIRVAIPFGKGISGIVAQTKKAINVVDAYKDERFNTEIDKQTGYHTKSLLTMPIFNYEGSVIGVAQIMNKQGGEELFTKQDEKIFEKFLVFCGISLTNAELFGLSLSEFKMNKLLLVLAKGIFAEQTKLDSLAKRIMLDIQNIISCERCILYLISAVPSHEQEVEISKAFDLLVSANTIVNLTEDAVKKFPASGFALKVSKSGESHEFDAKNTNTDALVSESGYVINNVLSMPVFDTHKKVIGVVQLINKINDEQFNPTDLKTITTFALFCGLGICNCNLYESMIKMIARQRVNLDVLSYYATASDTETEDLMKSVILRSQKMKLLALDFNDSALGDFETCKAIVTIFTELDLINQYKIQNEILCRWILSVKKNYRPSLYHNWRHAVNVAQTMFYCFVMGDLRTVLNDLEKFAMIVSALCHDLDYRSDIIRAKQPLPMLYSTVSVEHHYIDQCIMLLNNEKTNIFHSLGNDDYKIALELIETCILSTDLTEFGKKIRSFQDIASQEKINWNVEQNRGLLRSMLMVGCDVSVTCKPWPMQTKVANLVFTDYLRLNEDTTKTGAKSAKSAKKHRNELPKMEVGFFDSICLPLYMLLSNVFPLLKPLYNACLENRSNWKRLSDEVARLNL